MIGPPVLRRRILKGSGQPDRERAAVLMEGGGNAFMSYMNFGDEQDRSSFPTDDLAAQCAFVLGHLPGCDTKHITAPTCARPEEDVSKLLLPCMGKKASTGRRGSSTCAACGLSQAATGCGRDAPGPRLGRRGIELATSTDREQLGLQRYAFDRNERC